MNNNITVKSSHLHDFDRYHSNWIRIFRKTVKNVFRTLFRIK